MFHLKKSALPLSISRKRTRTSFFRQNEEGALHSLCRLTCLWVTVVVLSTFCACSARELAQPLTRVRIAMPLSPITYLPVYLARELGFYREHGLEVEIEDVPGGSKALQALFGGSADVCACVFELAIQLNSEGR